MLIIRGSQVVQRSQALRRSRLAQGEAVTGLHGCAHRQASRSRGVAIDVVHHREQDHGEERQHAPVHFA